MTLRGRIVWAAAIAALVGGLGTAGRRRSRPTRLRRLPARAAFAAVTS